MEKENFKKLNELTILEARELLDNGQVTSVELTKACLNRIEEVDSDINACLLVNKDEALKNASEADLKLQKGEKGLLLGIPYLLKDNIVVKGQITTAASKILENYIAPYNATVTTRLNKAGAVLLGKTNLDEFAHGASTENSAFQVTKNPYDLERVPGGSSGGSAAAVAANMCLFAIGSDTGGSIRQPASFCGVYGLKPSYGRVSRFGLLSMTSSTDVIGPLTKSVKDTAMVLEVISGVDKRDATSASFRPTAYLEYINKKEKEKEKEEDNKKLSGVKFGLPKEYFDEKLDKQVREKVMDVALKVKELGGEVKEISLPYTKYGIPAYYLITPSEISSNLARFDGVGWGLSHSEVNDLQDFYKKNRGYGFGPEVKRRIMLGTYALSAGYYDAYYKKAQAVRTLIINDFKKAFKEVDFIITPTTPHPAFKIGKQNNDPLAMYLEDIFVTGASLAGLPALSLPAGMVKVEEGNEMPIGTQIIGPYLKEAELLNVCNNISK
jgi:aspartyl-tRNA(Asn)/glutamyl-tRNA(Gln) amidotransferase subunit A